MLGRNGRVRASTDLCSAGRFHGPPFWTVVGSARRALRLPDLSQGGQLVLQGAPPRTRSSAATCPTRERGRVPRTAGADAGRPCSPWRVGTIAHRQLRGNRTPRAGGTLVTGLPRDCKLAGLRPGDSAGPLFWHLGLSGCCPKCLAFREVTSSQVARSPKSHLWPFSILLLCYVRYPETVVRLSSHADRKPIHFSPLAATHPPSQTPRKLDNLGSL